LPRKGFALIRSIWRLGSNDVNAKGLAPGSVAGTRPRRAEDPGIGKSSRSFPAIHPEGSQSL
jgi:hypothetical protein